MDCQIKDGKWRKNWKQDVSFLLFTKHKAIQTTFNLRTPSV